MRKRTKWLCLLFVVALIAAMAAGCSERNAGKGKDTAGDGTGGSGAEVLKTEGGGSKGNGRFFENEIVLPDKTGRILTLAKLEDGSLALLGEKKEGKSYSVFRSSDSGKSWKEVPVKGISDTHIPYAAVAPDGGAALIHYAKKGEVEIIAADAKGKTKEFMFQLPDGIKENQIRQAAYDKKGNLFVMDMEGTLLAVDFAKGSCKEVFDTKGIQVNYFGIAGNVMLAVHDKGILLFDTEKKNALSSEDILDDLIKKRNPPLNTTTT